jgi:hypothetical protein
LEEYEMMIRAIAAYILVALYPVIRATGSADPHLIFAEVASSLHTLKGRLQPAKALGAVTSTSRPQFERSNALHASKFNSDVATTVPTKYFDQIDVPERFQP